jgi:DNA-binding NarL/FixJ family response regulator
MTDTTETSDTRTDPVVDPREDDPPVTVALLHPDASRRSLLGRKLARSEGVELLLAASLATEAIDEVVDLLPDVVAIFPTDELVEVVERLTDEVPTVSVLVLDPEPEHFPALVAGARGTLPSGGSEITKAVAGIARDETVLTPEWAVLLVEAIDGVDERVRRLALLSETEREVLDRIGRGDSPREIADDHEVSERLANLHVGYAVGKYHRATEAVRVLDSFEAERDKGRTARTAPPPPPG